MKKTGKILLSTLTIVTFIILAIGSSEQSKEKSDNSELSNKETNNKYINGLSPVDVYMNFEKIGFSTEKQLNPDYGNLWINSLSENGIEYKVETYSKNIENVISVRGTAKIKGNKDIIATKQFFKFLGTLPFGNNNPKQTQQWIDKNFNNDKAIMIMGDVKITMFAPSKFVRMMTIEKII